MKKYRGFRLGRRFKKVFRWVFTRKTNTQTFRSTNPARHTNRGRISKLFSWAKGLCFQNSDPGYIRLGKQKIPKGHLAVYVGESDELTRRELVPVIYFNHPLFAELLKEAERIVGYNHPGGIQIPCRLSQFENIKTRIAAGETCRTRRRRKLVC